MPFEVLLGLLCRYGDLVVRLLDVEVHLVSEQKAQHSVLLFRCVKVCIIRVQFFVKVSYLGRELLVEGALGRAVLGTLLDEDCVLKRVQD